MIALYILLVFILVIAGIVASYYFAYSIIKPYLKTKESKKLGLKYLLILVIIGWGGGALIWYLNRQPAYFEQGIEQLHKSKYISKKIGDFNSYTFEPNKFVKDPISPTNFQVEINTDSLNLFLTCTMDKIRNEWVLVYIKEDSVRVHTP